MSDSRTQVVEGQRKAEERRRAHPPPYACTPEKAADLQALTCRISGISCGIQMERALAALRAHPDGVTALDIANHLDLPHPPSRIRDLRKAGLTVVSRWVRQRSRAGIEHRTALYQLEADDAKP